MLKKISALLALAFISTSLLTIKVQAQTEDPTLKGLNETTSLIPAFKDQAGATYGSDFLATRAGQIISVILSFVGVLFLILMIYAGIMWMTASGNDQQISKAKSLMINAIIGIVVVFSAYALTSFVGTALLQ